MPRVMLKVNIDEALDTTAAAKEAQDANFHLKLKDDA